MSAVTLVVAALILCAGFTGLATAAPDDTQDRTISVSGTGKVTTDPDRAVISLAVVTENTDVKVAQQQNAARMSAVIDALKTLGINSDDLKTTGYSVYPVYPVYEDLTSSSISLDRKIKYYRVTNTLQVTLKDITMAGSVIDTAVGAGADQINSISFTLSDEKQQELRSQALTAAVAQARGDADVVARALGVSIIGVSSVNVGSSYVPYAVPEAYDYKAAVGASSTPIETDTIDVTASVSISYLIN
jgi:uncharacterized protein YggE